MAIEISKTQIDRLGDRLSRGDISEADLRLLDEYRRTFSEAYEFVVKAVRNELGLEPTGRPAKSTTSISEKLERESIRLTQMQDIAGCRLIVPNILEQLRVVESVQILFDDTTVVDRREDPSNGYRAVHVVVKTRDRLVEIQVRTQLQHVWAELSEKFSDVVHPSIKYGGGDERIVGVLLQSSRVIAEEESNEIAIENLEADVSLAVAQKEFAPEKEKEVLDLQSRIRKLKDRNLLDRQESLRTLRQIVNQLPNDGDRDAVSH